jgi:hypothetical protein
MDFGRALCLLQDGLSPSCGLSSKKCRHGSEGKGTSSLIWLTKGNAMSNSKAIETKNKLVTIYGGLAIAFIAIFSTISILSWFVSALNF